LRTDNRVVVCRENQIQIDLDGRPAYLAYQRQRRILAPLTGAWTFRERRSSRRGHWHVTITLPSPMPAAQRCATAALFGSDLVREACNVLRVIDRVPYPIVFFER
jgi:hypothetical protein